VAEVHRHSGSDRRHQRPPEIRPGPFGCRRSPPNDPPGSRRQGRDAESSQRHLKIKQRRLPPDNPLSTGQVPRERRNAGRRVENPFFQSDPRRLDRRTGRHVHRRAHGSHLSPGSGRGGPVVRRQKVPARVENVSPLGSHRVPHHRTGRHGRAPARAAVHRPFRDPGSRAEENHPQTS